MFDFRFAHAATNSSRIDFLRAFPVSDLEFDEFFSQIKPFTAQRRRSDTEKHILKDLVSSVLSN